MKSPMAAGREAETDRRRQRVKTAVEAAMKGGTSISVSAIARQAGVDRTFLYRHRDLLALVHAAELEPAAARGLAAVSPVTLASLQADLANAQARNTPLSAGVQQLERRLSELMGEQAWRESGLGSHADVEALQRQITRLEQHNIELTASLEETREYLDAARGANRELTRALNQHKA